MYSLIIKQIFKKINKRMHAYLLTKKSQKNSFIALSLTIPATRGSQTF